MESVACNSCYLFSKRLLQQCGEDVRSAESIIGSLEAKLIDLKQRMHICMTSWEHNEVALLKAALSFREEMLSDHAVTFPTYYQKYVSKNSPKTPPSQVLLCVGKEFGDLHSRYTSCIVLVTRTGQYRSCTATQEVH